MINWNRSPVIICLWMILWGTEEQRLCKAVLSWHVSSDWNIDRMLSTFNHVLWSTHWHPLCNALWIMTEKKKRPRSAMLSEAPLNTCCGNSLWHQLGCFFFNHILTWRQTALHLTCLVQVTSTVHHAGSLLVRCMLYRCKKVSQHPTVKIGTTPHSIHIGT